MEDEDAGEAPRVDVFGKRVIGGEDHVDIDFAPWCVTVVLEFQTMVMVRVYLVRVISGCDSEWDQAEGGALEVDECLEGGCRLRGLKRG